jgi:LPXTG-motif cell wall-anchored protein
MTGSSLVLMGLASVLAAGGFVVLVARRRRDEVVA